MVRESNKRKHGAISSSGEGCGASVSRLNFPNCKAHSYGIICDSEGSTCDPPAYMEWFDSFNAFLEGQKGAKADGALKTYVGLDCEWAPPWWRDESGEAERVNTIQLYSPYAGALVFSTGSLQRLPLAFETLLADKRIALVGVNIVGDGARLSRDFRCRVTGLLNVAIGQRKSSMEDLAARTCPKQFHIKKSSIENKVRLSNWAQWPLTDLQVQYASFDAVLSFAIFFFQQNGSGAKWNDAAALCSYHVDVKDVKLEQQEAPEEDTDAGAKEQPKKKAKSAHSHFFIMHRNRSIVPPNLNKKEHPSGPANSLQGVVAIISGVLDSMSRDQMTKYIQKHGGKVVKSVTNSTTHLINDHGTVGPSKKKKCEAKNIPIVSENVIFELVQKSIEP